MPVTYTENPHPAHCLRLAEGPATNLSPYIPMKVVAELLASCPLKKEKRICVNESCSANWMSEGGQARELL